jgi:hypothetical protein
VLNAAGPWTHCSYRAFPSCSWTKGLGDFSSNSSHNFCFPSAIAVKLHTTQLNNIITKLLLHSIIIITCEMISGQHFANLKILR